ncbi:MAG: Gfo/Idh/MocA family oxidoreductase [Planctomycetaceae bacterium]
MHLVDARIEAVAAFTAHVGGTPVAIEDAAAVALRFAGGPLGTLTSGYYLDAGYQSHLRIWGSAGWLSLDTAAEPIVVVQRHGEPPSVVTPPRGGDVYAALVEAAARAAVGAAAPPLTTRDSLRAVRTVFAGYEAAATGRSVAVAD